MYTKPVLQEEDIEDPAYLCKLILVLNAAQHCPSLPQPLDNHTQVVLNTVIMQIAELDLQSVRISLKLQFYIDFSWVLNLEEALSF